MITLESWLSQKRFAHPEWDLADWRSLIQSALHLSKTEQRTHQHALSEQQVATLEHYAHRFISGEPLAYLVGNQAFLDFEVVVNNATLIPRADTETVALKAIEIAQELSKRFAPLTLWDFGTGSGILALALKRALPQAQVVAVDKSVKALEVAKLNAERLGVEILFRESDWFHAFMHQRAHLVVSKPPYIAADDEHLAALSHEPQSALVSAQQGYADLFHLIDHAPHHLHKGGYLLLEHGFEQAEQVAKRFSERNVWQNISTLRDLAHRPRATFAQYTPNN